LTSSTFLDTHYLWSKASLLFLSSFCFRLRNAFQRSLRRVLRFMNTLGYDCLFNQSHTIEMGHSQHRARSLRFCVSCNETCVREASQCRSPFPLPAKCDYFLPFFFFSASHSLKRVLRQKPRSTPARRIKREHLPLCSPLRQGTSNRTLLLGGVHLCKLLIWFSSIFVCT
jgi:hypothetical protein